MTVLIIGAALSSYYLGVWNRSPGGSTSITITEAKATRNVAFTSTPSSVVQIISVKALLFRIQANDTYTRAHFENDTLWNMTIGDYRLYFNITWANTSNSTVLFFRSCRQYPYNVNATVLSTSTAGVLKIPYSGPCFETGGPGIAMPGNEVSSYFPRPDRLLVLTSGGNVDVRLNLFWATSLAAIKPNLFVNITGSFRV